MKTPDSFAAESAPGSSGLRPFPPDSAVRRVHSEGALLLGGGRALLMQIAHPAVARGVAEHSNYATERWKRLLRTLRPMYAIVFGNERQAAAAVEGLNGVHKRVRGVGYDALDADLLLWVLATLIETSLEMHARFVRPLTTSESAAYYADMCRVGLLLQVPEEHLPANLTAFRAYFEATVAGLRVSDDARGIADELLQRTPLNAAFMTPLRLITAGTLPPTLRQQYGLDWGNKREKALQTLESVSRAVVPHLPARLRQPPWFLMPPRP
jgi:uncharacterized protein (DUF2236 family)